MKTFCGSCYPGCRNASFFATLSLLSCRAHPTADLVAVAHVNTYNVELLDISCLIFILHLCMWLLLCFLPCIAGSYVALFVVSALTLPEEKSNPLSLAWCVGSVVQGVGSGVQGVRAY